MKSLSACCGGLKGPKTPGALEASDRQRDSASGDSERKTRAVPGSRHQDEIAPARGEEGAALISFSHDSKWLVYASKEGGIDDKEPMV